VSINGTVTGDLIAVGERVTLRGSVGGNLFAAAMTVDVSGTIGGSVLGAGRSLQLLQTHIARNLYGGGRELTLGSGTDITGDAIAVGNDVEIGGQVGVDLLAFARRLSLNGSVNRHVDARGQRITLLAPARVGGNLTAHVGDPASVEIANGATVVGTVDTRIIERGEGVLAPPENKYLTFGFYVAQALRLAAAFVMGLLLLWLVPGLRAAHIGGGLDVVKLGGIGLATAVTLPVLCIILCLTIVGAPLGILGFVVGAVGLYFAKIVVAQFIGRSLYKSPQGLPHYAATLFAGLVVVLIAINLPTIGWLVSFVLTMVGLGMLVTFLARTLERREAY
jgi:hypothetical protein